MTVRSMFRLGLRRQHLLVLYGAMGVLSLFFGFIFQINAEFLQYTLSVRAQLVSITLLSFGAVALTGSAVIYYLDYGSRRDRWLLDQAVRSEVQELEAEAVEATSRVTPAQAASRATAILSRSPASQARSRRTSLQRTLIRRLEGEVLAQGRRANLNLAMGVIAALIGLTFLGWLAAAAAGFATTNAPTSAGANASATGVVSLFYWGAFLSKVLLSIAANVFAFFFLSTYRRNLSEIRYFQNELTNVQSMIMAVELSESSDDKLSKKKIMDRLSSVERNFVLKKGEATTDISLKKLDRDEVDALATLISKSVGSVRAAVTKGKR